MTRAVLADTGPLYAAVDPDDQYHARAQEQLQALAEQKLSVVLAYQPCKSAEIQHSKTVSIPRQSRGL